MAAPFGTSALVMALALVGVFAVVLFSRRWYAYTPGDGAVRTGPRLLANPNTWFIGFVVVALAAVGGVFVFVSSTAPTSLLSLPLLAFVGTVLSAFVLIAVYATARERGASAAIATAATATTAGALMLAAIALRLLTG